MGNKGIIITIEGDLSVCEPVNGQDFKLEEAQKIVGGYIECVHLDENTIMIVNENGKFEQSPNPVATVLALQKRAISNGDYICGNALVCASSMLR